MNGQIWCKKNQMSYNLRWKEYYYMVFFSIGWEYIYIYIYAANSN